MKLNHSLIKQSRRAKIILSLLATATWLGTATAILAASASDLLEQGIYSEETKGDLDAALQLYQQVVIQGKTSQNLAAQAQYHVGLCLYKKKDYTGATAAFQKVVTDYPDQKEVVALANDYLASSTPLQPAPWADGEEMQLDVKLGGGTKIGTIHYWIESGETNGQKIWRIGSRVSAGGQSYSRVEVDAETFKPIHSRWKHSLLGDVDAVYAPDHVDLKTAGQDAVKTMDLDGAVVDNEECVQWMRRLPMAVGCTNSVRVFASLASSVIPLKIEDSAEEKVTVPAGTYDCYKCDLSIGQTFWYSTDAHHYLVKFEAGGAIAELASVTRHDGISPVTYQDPTNLFSMTAPPGWIFDRQDSDSGKPVVSILDPDAAISAGLDFQNLDDKDATNTMRAIGEKQAARLGRLLKNYQVRPESWQERTVAGRPAISVVADYMDGEDKRVAYDIYWLDPATSNSITIYFAPMARDFDAMRPAFDGIVDSFKMK